jgi:hypothetical protein
MHIKSRASANGKNIIRGNTLPLDPGAVEFRRRAASDMRGAAAVENVPSRRRI